jgi:amino acid transporter
VIWGATWLNLRGSRTVGLLSGWFVGVVLLPFGCLAVAAFAAWLGHAPFAGLPVRPFHAPGTSFWGALGIGISQSVWNYSGWDNASTISGEIDQPSRAYPRALARALPLITIVYLATVVPVLAVTDWRRWSDGAWPSLAASILGHGFGVWLAVGGMVSAFALFSALLLAYSRVPLVLAEDRLLPAALAERDERGTPRRAVVVSALAYSVFALFSFGGLLAADVLLYSLALALEFAALVHLRRVEPDLIGAFRVPAGRAVLIVLAALPLGLIGLAVILELQSRALGVPGLLLALGLAVAGPAVYGLSRRAPDLAR